jgi:hypothetical protein
LDAATGRIRTWWQSSSRTLRNHVI